MEVVPEKPNLYAYLRPLNEDEKQNFNELSKIEPDVEFSCLEKHIKIGKNTVSVIDSEVQFYDVVISPLIRYIIAGYNCFLLLFGSIDASLKCKQMGNGFLSKKHETFGDIATKVLNNLFSLVNTKTPEASVHISLFEMLDEDMIVDVLNESSRPFYMKTFEIPNQFFTETQGLVTKPITNDDDISKILLKRHFIKQDLKYANCCHSVMYITVLQKKINSDSLEFLNVGNLTLVDLGHCTEKVFFEEICQVNEEGLKSDSETQNLREVLLKKVLQGAIGGNAKTSIVMNFDAASPTIKMDINSATLFLKLKDSLNKPEINKQLIVRSSLKEYTEEIQEIGRDIIATKSQDGLLLCSKLHCSLKNSLIFENETLKAYKQYHQILIDVLNNKKHSLVQLHLSHCELIEKIKKEEEDEEISAELEKLRNIRISLHEKISSVANRVISFKNNSKSCKTNARSLKMELSKMTRMHTRTVENIKILSKDLDAFYEIAQVEFSSFQANLDSVLVCLKTHLESANVEQSEILSKLSDLNSDANSILNSWKDCMDTLLSNLHVFIDIHYQNCCKIKNKMLSELMPLNTSQKEMIDILDKNRNAKIQMFSLFSQKIKSSTEVSIEILSEISRLLDEMLIKITKELRDIEVTFCNSGKELVKCIDGLNSALQKSKQYFPELLKSSAEINIQMSNQQQRFKKNIDHEIKKIKHSLISIREECSLYNESAVNVWNQRRRELFQMEQNTADLLKSLAQFQEKLPKIYKDAYCSNDNQYLNTLKDSNDNDKNMHCQLKKFHSEMKCAIQSFNEENKKLVSKEEKEINKFQNILCENVTRSFDNTLLMIDVNSKYVSKKLENTQKTLNSRYDNLKENICSNLSLLPELNLFFTRPQFVSENVINKGENCLKVTSEVNATNASEMESNDSFYAVFHFNVPATSTPNTSIKKPNLSEEKEKLINGIKKLIDSQNVKYENKASELERRNNESSASVPTLSYERKVESDDVRKNFLKIRTLKK